jgi:hypothetical protein
MAVWGVLWLHMAGLHNPLDGWRVGMISSHLAVGTWRNTQRG